MTHHAQRSDPPVPPALWAWLCQAQPLVRPDVVRDVRASLASSGPATPLALADALLHGPHRVVDLAA